MTTRARGYRRGIIALLSAGAVVLSVTSLASADTQIVGGTEADPHEFPATVQLRWRSVPNWRNAHICGGTLVHPRWVATAAHCLQGVNASQIEVVLGEHRLAALEGPEVVRTVAEIQRHPQYGTTTGANDLALLYLSSAAPLVPGVIEVAALRSAPAAGTTVTAVGWGMTQPPDTLPSGTPPSAVLSDPLLRADLGVSGRQECRDWVTGVGRPYSDQLCASAPTASSCHGDSGSPLYHWLDGRWVALGVTSFGVNCEGQTAYTRLSNYGAWINSWITLRANPGALDMRCFPMNAITGCSLQGPLGTMYPLQYSWSTNSYSSLRVVYPSPGSFPYSTGNGTIYFGLQNGGVLSACPSGTSMTMSVWFYNTYIGAVTRACP